MTMLYVANLAKKRRVIIRNVTKFLQSIFSIYVKDYLFFDVTCKRNSVLLSTTILKEERKKKWETATVSLDVSRTIHSGSFIINIYLYPMEDGDKLRNAPREKEKFSIELQVEDIIKEKNFMWFKYIAINEALLNENLNLIKLDIYECFEKYFNKDMDLLFEKW